MAAGHSAGPQVQRDPGLASEGVEIDYAQQNCKCRLCGDKDEMINNRVRECSKLVQQVYKTIHDWVGKVISWELCKKMKFDYYQMVYAQTRIHPWEWKA